MNSADLPILYSYVPMCLSIISCYATKYSIFISTLIVLYRSIKYHIGYLIIFIMPYVIDFLIFIYIALRFAIFMSFVITIVIFIVNIVLFWIEASCSIGFCCGKAGLISLSTCSLRPVCFTATLLLIILMCVSIY